MTKAEDFDVETKSRGDDLKALAEAKPVMNDVIRVVDICIQDYKR